FVIGAAASIASLDRAAAAPGAAAPAGAAAAVRAPAPMRHVPPAEATANEPLRVTASIDRAADRTLFLRYRPLGSVSWLQIEFTRGEGPANAWIATVP